MPKVIIPLSLLGFEGCSIGTLTKSNNCKIAQSKANYEISNNLFLL
jgi:hypothetical protein